MVNTALSPARSVDNDHHHHHDRHIGDVGDGGDDAAPLFDLAQTEASPDDDPVAVIEAALIRLKDDVGVLAEDNVVRAFSILKATDMPGYLRLRHAAKVANRDCSITVLDKLVRDELPGGGDDPSALDELVGLARSQCQLRHDADRNAVAVIPMPGRQKVWRIYSTGYEEWLRAAYWRAKEAGVPETTMKSALATIAAAAINDGEEVEIHLRAAREGDCYYLDLCDEHWRVVCITPRGWQLLDHSPVLFTRTQSMRPLPEPESGGDIGLLWQHAILDATRRQRWLGGSGQPSAGTRCRRAHAQAPRFAYLGARHRLARRFPLSLA